MLTMASSMLITPPADRIFYKYPHDYVLPSQRRPTSPLPPTSPKREPDESRTDPSYSQSNPTLHSQKMTSQHRGLPPPANLSLTDPIPRPSSKVGHSYPASSLAPVPQATPQVQSSDEQARQWYQAKMEEDKRRQEEERTRQEELKLEQRKLEHKILQESITASVPPPLIPMIFAGLGGAAFASAAFELAQQYLSPRSRMSPRPAQAAIEHQQQPQQPQQPGPSLAQQQHPHHQYSSSYPQAHDSAYRREPTLPHTYGLGSQQQAIAQTGVVQTAPGGQSYTSQHQHQQTPSQGYAIPAFQSPRRQPPLGGSSQVLQLSRPPNLSSLPRLTTGEGSLPNPEAGAAADQQSPSTNQWHHWQPPSSTTSGPSKEARHVSPKEGPGGSAGTEQSIASGSRKRKAQEPHQPTPAPQSAGRTTPPSATTNTTVSAPPSARRTGSIGGTGSHHARLHSDPPNRGFDVIGRTFGRLERDRSASLGEGQQPLDTGRIVSPSRGSQSRQETPNERRGQ